MLYLIICFCISAFAFLWIVFGCPNSLEIDKCQVNTWVRISVKSNPDIIHSEMNLLMTSLNFVVSVTASKCNRESFYCSLVSLS